MKKTKQAALMGVALTVTFIIFAAAGLFLGIPAKDLFSYLVLLYAGLFVCFGMLFVLRFVVSPFLSDAQRYGIDENGAPNKRKP